MGLSLRRVIGGVIFVAAYVLLYFGLYGALVHYAHYMQPNSEWFSGESDKWIFKALETFQTFLNDKPVTVIPPTTRSLVGDTSEAWSMLHVLLHKAHKGECSYIAPGILIIFGIVFPTFKLLAMLLWAILPGDCGSITLLVAARLTRWTAVDAVAEAMIVALLLIGGVVAEHRLGYVAFVGYCLLSAVATWVIDDTGMTHGPGLAPRVMAKLCRPTYLPSCLSVITFVIFLCSFLFGLLVHPVAEIWVPSQALTYNLRRMLKPYHHMLVFMGENDEVNRLISDVAKDVPLPTGEGTVVQAAIALLYSGHIYTVVGSAVLFTGVVVCPLVEASIALYLAIRGPLARADDNHYNSEQEDLMGNQYTEPTAAPFDCARWVMDAAADLSMLDVFVFGMFVASLVLSTLGDVLQCKLEQGFYSLLPAVAFSYLHTFVSGTTILAAEHQEEELWGLRRKLGSPGANDAKHEGPTRNGTLFCCSRRPPASATAVAPTR